MLRLLEQLEGLGGELPPRQDLVEEDDRQLLRHAVQGCEPGARNPIRSSTPTKHRQIQQQAQGQKWALFNVCGPRYLSVGQAWPLQGTVLAAVAGGGGPCRSMLAAAASMLRTSRLGTAPAPDIGRGRHASPAAPARRPARRGCCLGRRAAWSRVRADNGAAARTMAASTAGTAPPSFRENWWITCAYRAYPEASEPGISNSLSFELLVSSVQNQAGWSIFIVLYPGQHYVCVCVHACFHIVLHVFGITRLQITSLEHMLAA